ncbi:MAG: DUF502 domain-containing protein [Phycisphaerales bacterium]|nr:DUF502 domain-containing protein [Phycisphaerales bacterium]
MAEVRHTFMSDFRKFFVRGLGIVLPSLLTLAILLWAYRFLRVNIAEPINWGVRHAVLWAGPRTFLGDGVAEDRLPDWWVVTAEEQSKALEGSRRRWGELTAGEQATLRARIRSESFEAFWRDHWYLQGIGFVVAIVAVYLAGVFVGNFIGRRVYGRVESALVRLPIIKQVYPNVKQIVEFMIGDDKKDIASQSSKVVVLEYPRKGIWSVGLLTGGTLHSIEQWANTPCVTIFIPSSPTPFTGYTITVPAEDVYEIGLTFDEAVRFVVSGGVLVPKKDESKSGAEQLVRRIALPNDSNGKDRPRAGERASA